MFTNKYENENGSTENAGHHSNLVLSGVILRCEKKTNEQQQEQNKQTKQKMCLNRYSNIQTNI